MKLVLIFLLFISAGCSNSQSIPPPVSQAYKGIYDAKDWRNPYLIVSADGVEVRGVAEQIPVRAVATTLAGLPQSSWPYGKIVGVSMNGITAWNDKDGKRTGRNWSEVMQDLKRLDIQVRSWPSN